MLGVASPVVSSLAFAAGAISGLVVGYILGYRNEDTFDAGLGGIFTNAFALLITAIWAFSVYKGATTAEYTTPWIIHGIMGIIVGSLFAVDGDTARSIALVLGQSRNRSRQTNPDEPNQK